MAPLTRKLLRDLARLKGQVFTIGLVVGCGIASLVGLRSTFSSLAVSRDAYYERHRFAQVFASARRAPEWLARKLEALPGVARVYTRVVEEVRLQPPGEQGWVNGRLVSVPDHGEPPLNGLVLRSGRLPEPSRPDEVLVLEAFAGTFKLRPGERLRAVINGKLRDLQVVGTALSPEYVYALRPGALSDEGGRFGILWMPRRALAAAFDQEGTFNDVCLALKPGASEGAVTHDLDRLLEPFGGFGAVGRARQSSNQILESELGQLDQMATMIPLVFLAVAAFLVNVVLSRLVSLQRAEIAALKALGYSNREVAGHLFGLVFVIVLLGALLGTAGGAAYGRWMTDLYADYFRFPVLEYRLGRSVLAGTLLVSVAAAGSGAWFAIRAALRLPPAEAMRPPAPPSYRASSLGRSRLGRLLGPMAMMILREIIRRPLRTFFSAVGIGAAVGIMIVGRFSYDSLEYLLSVLVLEQQREDLSVAFPQPVSERSLGEVRLLPGVLAAEGLQVVPTRISSDGRFRDVPLIGLAEGSQLRRIVERSGRAVQPSSAGLLLTSKLAEILGVRPGSNVLVEEREGQRRRWLLPVGGLADEGLGLQAYLGQAQLDRLRGERRRISMLLLRVDPSRREQLLRRLDGSPRLSRVDSVREMVAGMRDQTGKYMSVITVVVSILAGCIAVGVVYNNARVSLSQRARDLASLRVLGFSRVEVSGVLLGEMGVQIAIGLPFGVLLGHWWAQGIAETINPEMMRFPVIVSASTHAIAIGVAVLAGLASALWVRRRLDHLDLIAVLKTRE
jgi:putative ABC transport system permease protein